MTWVMLLSCFSIAMTLCSSFGEVSTPTRALVEPLSDLELATMTVDDMIEAFLAWERGEEWSPARGEVAPRNHADRVDALVTALNRCTTTGVHEWSECEKNPEKAQNRTPAVLQGPRLARSGRPDSRITVKRRLALSKAWERLVTGREDPFRRPEGASGAVEAPRSGLAAHDDAHDGHVERPDQACVAKVEASAPLTSPDAVVQGREGLVEDRSQLGGDSPGDEVGLGAVVGGGGVHRPDRAGRVRLAAVPGGVDPGLVER